MLVKDETKYCWVLDEYAGEPQNSIEDAIKDFIETYSEVYETGDSDHSYMCDCYMPHKQVKIGHPYYYAPEIDGECILEHVINYAPDKIYDQNEDYLFNVKREHIDELSEELTKVFRSWEKRYGYENGAFVVQETKTYRIGDYVKGDKC